MWVLSKYLDDTEQANGGRFGTTTMAPAEDTRITKHIQGQDTAATAEGLEADILALAHSAEAVNKQNKGFVKDITGLKHRLERLSQKELDDHEEIKKLKQMELDAHEEIKKLQALLHTLEAIVGKNVTDRSSVEGALASAQTSLAKAMTDHDLFQRRINSIVDSNYKQLNKQIDNKYDRLSTRISDLKDHAFARVAQLERTNNIKAKQEAKDEKRLSAIAKKIDELGDTLIAMQEEQATNGAEFMPSKGGAKLSRDVKQLNIELQDGLARLEKPTTPRRSRKAIKNAAEGGAEIASSEEFGTTVKNQGGKRDLKGTNGSAITEATKDRPNIIYVKGTFPTLDASTQAAVSNVTTTSEINRFKERLYDNMASWQEILGHPEGISLEEFTAKTTEHYADPTGFHLGAITSFGIANQVLTEAETIQLATRCHKRNNLGGPGQRGMRIMCGGCDDSWVMALKTKGAGPGQIYLYCTHCSGRLTITPSNRMIRNLGTVLVSDPSKVEGDEEDAEVDDGASSSGKASPSLLSGDEATEVQVETAEEQRQREEDEAEAKSEMQKAPGKRRMTRQLSRGPANKRSKSDSKF